MKRRQKELHYKVADRGHYSNDYAQLGEDEVTIFLSALLLFSCLNVRSHFIMCLAPWLCKPIDIYRYIYERDIFSTTDDVFVLLLD